MVLVDNSITACVLYTLDLAPGVVIVLCYKLAIAVVKANHVPAPVMGDKIGIFLCLLKNI